jgi:hypothetical protein
MCKSCLVGGWWLLGLMVCQHPFGGEVNIRTRRPQKEIRIGPACIWLIFPMSDYVRASPVDLSPCHQLWIHSQYDVRCAVGCTIVEPQAARR